MNPASGGDHKTTAPVSERNQLNLRPRGYPLLGKEGPRDGVTADKHYLSSPTHRQLTKLDPRLLRRGMLQRGGDRLALRTNPGIAEKVRQSLSHIGRSHVFELARHRIRGIVRATRSPSGDNDTPLYGAYVIKPRPFSFFTISFADTRETPSASANLGTGTGLSTPSSTAIAIVMRYISSLSLVKASIVDASVCSGDASVCSGAAIIDSR